MAVITREIVYGDGTTNFKSLLAYDDNKSGARPGVMIAPTFAGRNNFVAERAEELARLGYAALALDIYGDGRVGQDIKENRAMMKPLMEDRTLVRDRMQLGFDAIAEQPEVDSDRIAAIGYCLGGLCVLDLARSGADVKGVVSLHGLLVPPGIDGVNTISAKVLVLHGHDDPMVPPSQVLDFEKEMSEAQADWQVHAYGHTVHAFTNRQANDPDFGTVYSETANRRSWQSMCNFFDEIFQA